MYILSFRLSITRQTSKQKDRLMDGWMGGRTDGWMVGRTDRWIGGYEVDGLMDRYIGRKDG